MAQIFEMTHPLIQHKISMLRNADTTVKDFRALANEIALLMGYEATRDLTLEDIKVQTPLAVANGKAIQKQVAIVPILRAGLGMVDAILSLIPAAKVGHIGLYRDHETLEPVAYYCKLQVVLFLTAWLQQAEVPLQQLILLSKEAQTTFASCA